jgi:His/Glu/Gln/Arg/opine family amino acid ABC transporter permease subunit
VKYHLDWHAVLYQLPLLSKGLVLSVEIALCAYFVSIVAGLLIALLRRSDWLPVWVFAFLYTQFFRSISVYIYIIWIYFGLAVALGIKLDPFSASVLAIALLHSAYVSEIFRAAIAAVPIGQREAARSLGLGRFRTFGDVVLPLAGRLALPQLVNQLTMIIKDSSVVSLIGAKDLMAETISAANLQFRTFEFYTTAALMYLAMVLLVSALSVLLERHLRVGLV